MPKDDNQPPHPHLRTFITDDQIQTRRHQRWWLKTPATSAQGGALAVPGMIQRQDREVHAPSIPPPCGGGTGGTMCP